MTTTLNPPYTQDVFARRLAQRLTAGTADLPYDVSERLRAARVQALARRKQQALGRVPAVAVSGSGGTATLGFGGLSVWGRLGSALPLLALVAGLVLIHKVENDQRAREVAEVDAALLTDDLPPAAYADPGFVQFLKSGEQ